MKKIFVVGEYHPIHLYLRANELKDVIPLLKEKNLIKELYRAIKLEKIARNEARRILQMEINHIKKKKPQVLFLEGKNYNALGEAIELSGVKYRDGPRGHVFILQKYLHELEKTAKKIGAEVVHLDEGFWDPLFNQKIWLTTEISKMDELIDIIQDSIENVKKSNLPENKKKKYLARYRVIGLGSKNYKAYFPPQDDELAHSRDYLEILKEEKKKLENLRSQLKKKEYDVVNGKHSYQGEREDFWIQKINEKMFKYSVGMAIVGSAHISRYYRLISNFGFFDEKLRKAGYKVYILNLDEHCQDLIYEIFNFLSSIKI
jgi:hypothetical protein